VWPLITGLSVFGLAIGFGSQTLVKDVVSGLFFLIDDAFRFGEYIETSGAKGTVEKISVRSVTLRNSRGSVSTVPYGQMGKIQNFSRDWVIEKLTFRVAFDTDVELVRKLFKKIGEEIAADPELAPDLIEPFKSQGIGDVEDGTLIIRTKFTAKPGKQSMIRRAALKAVHKAFREWHPCRAQTPDRSRRGAGSGVNVRLILRDRRIPLLRGKPATATGLEARKGLSPVGAGCQLPDDRPATLLHRPSSRRGRARCGPGWRRSCEAARSRAKRQCRQRPVPRRRA
jgi:hypothetical protein